MRFMRQPVAHVILSMLLLAACRDDAVTGPRAIEPFQRTSTLVPETPPDSMAGWVTESANWVTDDAHVTGSFVKDLVVIRFVPGATQQQRQSAIDGIGGTVVGGVPFDGVEGAYYVALPADTTHERLFAAIDTLNTLPQIDNALPDLIVADQFVYRRPTDDTTRMRASDWRLNPDSAFGQPGRLTWALEAVNAPYAWGCSTGDASTKVAVIDGGLRAGGGIVGNILDTARMNPGAFTHGTQVASVLGARGNDTSGTTGLMWTAGLLLYGNDRRDSAGNVILVQGRPVPDPIVTAAQITRAMAHGARVINISVGINVPHTGPHTAQQDSARAYLGRLFRNAVVRSPNPRPLLVLAAGNAGNATTAYWSVYAAVADYLPNETMIVTGASSTQGALWSDAVTGTPISIAAPAEAVTTDNGTAIVQADGTSFAAPLVSGAAGLLISFDSSLTASRVKQLLDTGAIQGGRMAGPYPVLDVYASLRLAAKRTGAPLCGNRVWKSGDVVYAQRGSTDQAIATLPHQDWQSSFISVYHGGRRFDMDWSREFLWNVGTGLFDEQSSYDSRPYGENGGTFLSYDGENHDNTRFFKAVVKSQDNSGFVVEAEALRFNGDTIQAMSSPRFPRGRPSTVCVRRDAITQACAAQEGRGDWDDLENISPGYTRLLAAADAVDSTRMYVVVNMLHHHIDLPTSWAACSDDPAYECANGGVSVDSSATTAVYRVSFATNTWTAVTLPASAQGGKTIEWIGISETGKEMVYGIGHTGQQYQQATCTDQATDFVSLEAPTAGQILRHIALPTGAVCSGEYEAGGTIAPLRAPLGSPGLTHASAPIPTRNLHGRRTGRGTPRR